MRRIVVAASLSLGLGLLVPMQPAAAAERCITRAEFRAAKVDMTIAHVHRIFDTAGRKSWDEGRYLVRKYVPCSDRQFGWVTVSYKDGRLVSKRANW